MSKHEQILIALWVAAAAVVLALGSKLSPGGSVKVPAAQTEGKPGAFIPPPGVPDPTVYMAGPFGLIVTPHRYPETCGNDITALIHHGFSVMALPAGDDMTWLSAPPSEAEL